MSDTNKPTREMWKLARAWAERENHIKGNELPVVHVAAATGYAHGLNDAFAAHTKAIAVLMEEFEAAKRRWVRDPFAPFAGLFPGGTRSRRDDPTRT